MEVGPFTLVEPVGRGGFAEVWRARHASGLEAAVKLLHGTSARTRQARTRLRDEARAVARLRHPAVVVLYELGFADSGPWLAMELAEGTLAERVGRLSWPEQRAILTALLRALGHAHAHGLVHRDVKPSNVLLRGDGRPVLADFGVASAIGRGSTAGTPGYVAPEALDGRPVGPEADLYALGVLAWVLATGRAPWEGRGPGEPLPPLPVPSELDAWLAWLTAADPRDRPPFAADALAALHGLGDAAGVSEGGVGELDAATTRGAAPMSLPATRTFTRQGRTTAWADPLSLPGADGAEVVLAGPLGAAPPAPDAPPAPLVVPEPPRGVGLSLVRLREPALVGRRPEQEELWAALVQTVRTGAPSVLRLRGPAGSGKSRLASWLRRTASEHGVARSAEARPGPEGLAWRGLGTSPARPHELVAALREIAGERAVVLVLDDAHDAPDAVGWISAAVQSPLAPPVVLLVCSREGEAEVELAPLAPTARLALAEGLGLTGAVADRLVDRSGGNPGLAVQLVEDWVQRGLLAPSPTGFVLAPGVELPVPDSVEEAWRGRVEGWLVAHPDGERALVTAAALADRIERADFDALVADDDLLEAGLLEADGDAVRWSHRGLREAVRRRAEGTETWIRAHRRCLSRLAEQPGEALALRRWRHLLATGDVGGAVEQLMIGEKHLNQLGSWVGSTALLLEARDQLARAGVAPDDPRWLRVQLRLAQNTTRQLRRLDEAEAMLDEVQEPVLATGERWLVHTLWLARGVVQMGRGRLERAVEVLACSVDAARGDARLEAIALRHLAMAHGRMGRLADGSAEYERAAALLRSVGDEVGEANCLLGAAGLLYSTDPARARALTLAVHSTYEARGMAPGQADCHNQLGDIERKLGDLPAAREHYALAAELFARAGLDRVVFPRINLALVHCQLGEWDAAAARFDEVFPLCRDQPWVHACATLFAQPVRVLDEGWEEAFDAAVAKIEQMRAFEPDGVLALQMAAERAEAAGREDRAARCREVARRFSEALR